MNTAELPIDTPTIVELKNRGAQREYLFAVGEGELRRLRAAQLCPAAILAYAAIRGAIRASGSEWASVSVRSTDALGFPQDWWRVNVRRLVSSGFIDTDQRRGARRRYRLRSAVLQLTASGN